MPSESRRMRRPTAPNPSPGAASSVCRRFVAELLRTHRALQSEEQRRAAQLWQGGGWVFASPIGRPLNPNTDYHEWKKLLKDAGVRDGRLHDARHTAATVLMLLGVQERAAMDVMGWATTGMAARYQHVSDPVRADIAKRVGLLIGGRGSRPLGLKKRTNSDR